MTYGPEDCCGECGYPVPCACDTVAPSRPSSNKMTVQEMIVHTLSWPPYKNGATATQIHQFLAVTERKVKLTSLSSQLAKMVNAGKLKVLPDFGPRGGNGYVLQKGRK